MAINFNKYCVVDFETNGLGDGKQPVSIGAVMIDPRRLEICDNGTFYSLISLIEDDEVEKYGLDKTDPKALQINKLSMEDIRKAPPLKKVWKDFHQWVNFHNPPKTKWDAPIFTGYNVPFDLQIVNRIMDGHLRSMPTLKEKLISKKEQKEKTPEELAKLYKNIELLKECWGCGPDWLFHPAKTIDVMQITHLLFESFREPHKNSLDMVKGYLGFNDKGAHNALVDCLWTAEIFIRYLKIQRQISGDTDFCTGGTTILPIGDYV